jgi:hypothetical protein
VLGQQTAIGKAFAVAQAVINTWQAATAVLKDETIPSTVARIAMMAVVIGQGLAAVRNIMSVDTGGGGSTASSTGSITASPASTRILATPAGASTLAPSAAQQSANITYSSGLTADAIANAMRNMPAPKVTVEDINAKISEMQQVEVAATV